MNKKLLALCAVGLLAGPLAANATASGCTFVDDILECDLYESGGSTTIDLSEFLGSNTVSEGTIGITETGEPSNYRDVLSFTTVGDASILDFFFGTLPDGPFYFDFERTGDVTTIGTEFLYRVHHDYRAAVPEPGSLALLGLGLVGLGLSRRRKAM